MLGTGQPAPTHPQPADPSAQVKMPPARVDIAPVVPAGRRERTPRAGQPPPPQRDLEHDRPITFQRLRIDANDPDTGQVQDTVE
jgi:hypothetical protein